MNRDNCKRFLAKYYYRLDMSESQFKEYISQRLCDMDHRISDLCIWKCTKGCTVTYFFVSFECTSHIMYHELFHMNRPGRFEVETFRTDNIFSDTMHDLERQEGFVYESNSTPLQVKDTPKCNEDTIKKLKGENELLNKKLREVIDENIMLKRKCELLLDAYKESKILIIENKFLKDKSDHIEKNYADLLNNYKALIDHMKTTFPS